MGYLDKLFSYAGKWSLKSTEDMPQAEKARIRSAKVVSGDYGLSICMILQNGTQKYDGLSRDSALVEGDNVDVNSLKIVTLEKEGSEDCTKLDGVAL